MIVCQIIGFDRKTTPSRLNRRGRGACSTHYTAIPHRKESRNYTCEEVGTNPYPRRPPNAANSSSKASASDECHASCRLSNCADTTIPSVSSRSNALRAVSADTSNSAETARLHIRPRRSQRATLVHHWFEIVPKHRKHVEHFPDLCGRLAVLQLAQKAVRCLRELRHIQLRQPTVLALLT